MSLESCCGNLQCTYHLSLRCKQQWNPYFQTCLISQPDKINPWKSIGHVSSTAIYFEYSLHKKRKKAILSFLKSSGVVIITASWHNKPYKQGNILSFQNSEAKRLIIIMPPFNKRGHCYIIKMLQQLTKLYTSLLSIEKVHSFFPHCLNRNFARVKICCSVL